MEPNTQATRPKPLAAIAVGGRCEFTQRMWASLVATTTPDELDVGIIDTNSPQDATTEWLKTLQDPRLKFKLFEPENIGTARAINKIWAKRLPGQPCFKIDDDIEWLTSGWVTRMLAVIDLIPSIGVVGLKRDDLAERCAHPRDPIQPASFFLSKLFELSSGELIECCHHVMGTCTLFSPRALERIGYLYQMQDLGNQYGFDDSLAAVRLAKAGFESCFLRGISIVHFDPGEGGTPENAAYTRRKQKSAGEWIPIYEKIANEIARGSRPVYWKDE